MSPQSFFHSPKAVCAAAVFSAALPGVALADSQKATITSLLTDQLVIHSNGASYTQMPPLTNLVADVRIQADAGAFGKIKHFAAYLAMKIENGDALPFSNFAYSETFPSNKRPKSIDQVETIVVTKSAYEAYLVARCNSLADNLRADGLTDAVIFGEDRSFEVGVAPRLEVDFSGPDNILPGLEQAELWETTKKVEVVCKRWSGPAIPQAGKGLASEMAQVVNHGLSLLQISTLNGACKIRLDGWITTDFKNIEVTFRYKNQDGKLSQIHSVNTGDNKTATFSHWYDVPNNPDGGESGHVWMTGVSHDFHSEIAAYSLNCVEGGPDGLVSNDPPKLTMTVVPQGKVMVHGRICPEVVKLVGVLAGQGNFSGQTLFYGPGYLSPLQDYSITHGQKVIVGAEAELDWDDVEAPSVATAPLGQMREFGLNVTNQDNVVIAALPKKKFAFVCRMPAVVPGIQLNSDLTGEPRNPAARVKRTQRFKAPDQVAHQAAPQAAPMQILKSNPATPKRPQNKRQKLIEERRLKPSAN